MESVEKLLEEYCRELVGKGFSASTVEAYGLLNLGPFLDFLTKKGVDDLRRVTADDLLEYRVQVMEGKTWLGKPYRWGTISMRIRTVKRFFGWLEETGRILLNPAGRLEEPRKLKKFPVTVLTEDEAERLVVVPDTSTTTGLREKAVLEVLYSTGLRLGELVGLLMEDVDFEGGVVRVNGGKGAKDRVVPLGDAASRCLKAYVIQARPHLLRRDKNEKHLFLSRYGTPLMGGLVQRMVGIAARRAGIERQVTPHTLRHTCATLMVRRGAPIQAVSLLLGHADLTSTQIYTHVAGVDVKETHEASHPRERGKVELEKVPAVAHV
jgi:integrase/recombinase XerD